ncbi:MAG: hypothetical protein R3E44_09105 [Paracoccaceae bacterium]
MRRLARVVAASAAVTLTLAYVALAAAVVVTWSPRVDAEPAACHAPTDSVGSTVVVTDL